MTAALARPLGVARLRTAGGPRVLVLDGALLILAVASLARFALTALTYGIPAWFDEELPPLLQWRELGVAISHIDQRQYGPLVFLVFDPALRLLGSDYGPLQRYAMVLAVTTIVLAFLLIGRRYARSSARAWLVLTVAWFSFVPTLYVVAQRMVDAWQLLFVTAALLLLTGSRRSRAFSGVPLAFAALTKILPGLLLLYVAIRDWRAGVTGALAGALVLGAGQVLYGSLLGFGYPLALLAGGSTTVASWSLHYENNSVRGLLFKLADGYRLAPDSMQYLLAPDRFSGLNVAAYALEAALVGYLLLRAWQARKGVAPQADAVGFCLAVTTMLLASPHTAQDYTIVLLPVLVVGGWSAWRGWPRPWPAWLLGVGILAALLVGVFVPLGWADRLPPIHWLVAATGNSANTVLTGDVGSGIGAYDFFGFPGAGLVLAWVIAVRLDWLARRTPDRVA